MSLLLLGVGCSDKEGALLKVTSELDKQIVSLRFIIGEDTVAGSDHFSDTRGLEIVGVQDRDLSSDPYLLFLNSKNFGEESQRLYSQDLVVGVVALNEDGIPIGYGVSDTIQFGAGQIREWTVPIKKLDDGFIDSEHCVQWGADDTRVYIGLTGDEDCDGDLAGAFPGDPDADCDDRDPDRYHGRTEICDNGLDDNCNGMPDELEDDDDDGFLLCDESESQRDCDDNDRETFPRSAKVCGEDTLICSSMESPPSREGLKCFTEGIGDGCVGGLWSCDGSDNGELVCDTMDGAYPVRPGFCTADPNCVQDNPDECIPTEMVSCSFSYTTNMPIQVCGSDGMLAAGSFSFPIPAGPPGCVQSK
ncbi:MAG: hypothetical protein JKY56_13675, partial [Kofleriaceae bacterium]|nr:hypothetical protein [Kofleriaceae bacterium]